MASYLTSLTTIIGPVRPPKKAADTVLQLIQAANAFAEAAQKYSKGNDQKKMRLTKAAEAFQDGALRLADKMMMEPPAKQHALMKKKKKNAK